MISPTPSGARTSTHSTVPRLGRVRFHVKGLAFLGVVGDHHRSVKGFGQKSLLRRPQVVSPINLIAAGRQARHCLGVAQAGEGGPDGFQGGRRPLQGGQLGPAVGQHPFHDKAEQGLRQGQNILQFGKGNLRLQHPEFRQVPPGLGFFRPKGRSETIDLPQGQGRRLQIQLAALGQIGLAVAEIVRFKQGGGPFAGGGGKDRRIHQDKPALPEKIPAGPDDFVPNPQDRLLPGAADPQMAVVQEKIHPMLLVGDGVFLGDGQRLHRTQIQFKPARSPGFGPYQTRHRQRGLLGQSVKGGEVGLGNLPFHHHALHQAGPVPQDEKPHLAAGAFVIQPPP